MIAPDDQIYLGPLYQFEEGIPDRVETGRDDLYSVRFMGAGPEETLGEVGIPLNYNSPELTRPVPITFFGFLAPFPRDTRRVEIWNRRADRLIAVREVTESAPQIRMTSPVDGQAVRGARAWEIAWTSSDRDSKDLATSVLVSADGQQWTPLAYRVAGDRYQVEGGALRPGRYLLKLAVNDESHVRETPAVHIEVSGRERLR
jgi:hypothetical protein